MSRPADRRPYLLKITEPSIGRALVTDATPYPLLRIQSRLIRWQEVHPYLGMAFEEAIDLLSPMPTSSIHIEPNRETSKPADDLSQHPQEALPISPNRSNHTVASQQWGHPSGHIQPLLVLTGCRNAQPLTPQSPAPSKPRVQREAGFVLKNYRLLRPQRLEFFLMPAESVWLGPSELECTHKKPAWADSLTDAANSALAAPSNEYRTGVSHARQRSDHPTAHGVTRSSRETPADGRSESCVSQQSDDSDVQPWNREVTPVSPWRSQPGAIGSRSNGVPPELPRSRQVAALRTATATPQSSDQTRHQEFAWPAPPTSPGWPRDGLGVSLSFTQGIMDIL